MTQQEYNDIKEKKMEEMSEQYKGRGSDKEGIEIRIGG